MVSLQCMYGFSFLFLFVFFNIGCASLVCVLCVFAYCYVNTVVILLSSQQQKKKNVRGSKSMEFLRVRKFLRLQ